MLYDCASIRYRLGPDIATMAVAAACGPPTDYHAGLSVLILIWLRLYRPLLHINEKLITDFLVLRYTGVRCLARRTCGARGPAAACTEITLGTQAGTKMPGPCRARGFGAQTKTKSENDRFIKETW